MEGGGGVGCGRCCRDVGYSWGRGINQVIQHLFHRAVKSLVVRICVCNVLQCPDF